MELNDITVFVDESGTIGKGTIKEDDFFIITLLFVKDEDVNHIKKVFKKERLKIVNKKDALKQQLKNNKEVKGSELSEIEKRPIYEKLIEKCGDKFEIAVIVMNNRKATVKFRSNSSRSFNYLIKTFLEKHFKKRSRFKGVNQIHFVIDERNVATESKYTLQEYLNTELNLVESFSEKDIATPITTNSAAPIKSTKNVIGIIEIPHRSTLNNAHPTLTMYANKNNSAGVNMSLFTFT